MNELHVLVAHGNDLIRGGITAILSTQAAWSISVAKTGRDALAKAQLSTPHVAILDIDLHDADVSETLQSLRELNPDIEILLIATEYSDDSARRALTLGARGYLTTGTAARDLVDAVSRLAAHQAFLGPRISEFLLKQYGGQASRGMRQSLSSRERQVLRLIADGKTSKEVAGLIGTSPKTVETYRARIMRKLHAKSFAELVRYALRAGLVNS